MAGFLKRLSGGEDAFAADEMREEMYLRLFPKIGRDFVTIEDLIDILIDMSEGRYQDSSELAMAIRSKHNALEKAREYKRLLDYDLAGDSRYKDLIDLDD
jgi:hypothetical protein